jgi:ABC-2 type transport system permease protein
VADTTALAASRAARPGVAAAYLTLARSRVAAQVSYRTSFAFDLAAQGLLGAIEFVEVYVVFHQVDALGGFSYAEVALLYGIANCAFGLADAAVGHIERLPFYVRTGQLDAFLLRPLGTLGQVVTSDFSLRRLGRVATGLAVLVVAVEHAHTEWTPARAVLIVVTPLAGAVVFCALFVATAAVSFWFVEGTEFANAFTYGGEYLASFPMTVLQTAVRRFFTFVVPIAFVAYLPTLALLGRPDPNGLPGWLSWSAPLVALVASALAALLWRAGVRHYVGAAS